VSGKGHTAWCLAQLPTDECVIWPGALGEDGYGQHGMVWRAYTGQPAPKRPYSLDHLCRNRACVNPAHLEPLRLGENCARSPFTNVSKTHCKRGHPFDEANTYLYRGFRRCRACERATLKAWKARNPSGRAAARETFP